VKRERSSRTPRPSRNYGPAPTLSAWPRSTRNGPLSDMLALNIDLASVMQAGRWKTTVMPMRYGEEVQAGRGGMARTAKAQGRAK
jgi:hypothetical protein